MKKANEEIRNAIALRNAAKKNGKYDYRSSLQLKAVSPKGSLAKLCLEVGYRS